MDNKAQEIFQEIPIENNGTLLDLSSISIIRDKPGWVQDGKIFDFDTYTDQWDIMSAITQTVLKYRKGPIVEIGMGSSSLVFSKIAKRENIKLYSCDLLMGGIFDSFQNKLFDDHICFIGKSEDFIKQFQDIPAIVFIDGQHDYEVVKKEAEFFLDKLMIGGVMFLHDTFPFLDKYLKESMAHDVYKARQELEQNPDIDVLSFPYSAINAGLTMVMKHPKNDDRPYWLRNGRVA